MRFYVLKNAGDLWRAPAFNFNNGYSIFEFFLIIINFVVVCVITFYGAKDGCLPSSIRSNLDVSFLAEAPGRPG